MNELMELADTHHVVRIDDAQLLSTSLQLATRRRLAQMNGTDIDLRQPSTQDSSVIVVLTGSVDPAIVRAAIDAGAAVELTKVSDSLLGTTKSSRLDDILTSREQEVLQLLAEGVSTQNIATQLYVSPHTVRNHIRRILGKLGVHSRLEAVVEARRIMREA